MLISLLLSASVFAFELPATLSAQEVSFPLPALEKVLGAATYSVTEETVDLSHHMNEFSIRSDDDGKRLQVAIKGLDPKQCEAVKAAYAGARSPVDCASVTPDQKLDLTQFLEPAIQATNGQTFAPERYSLDTNATYDSFGELHIDWEKESEEKDSTGNGLLRVVQTETNCWGTAWEIARKSTTSLDVQVGDQVEVMAYMLSPKNSKEVIAAEKNLSKFRAKAAAARYGDILVVKTGKFVVHMATFVDQELLFERKGNSAMYLNRLMGLEAIGALYVDGFSDVSFSVIRPLALFPAMREVFKDWRYEFGPKSEDYEGQSFITYHSPVTYALRAANGRFTLGARSGSMEMETAAELDSLAGEPENLAELSRTLARDPWIAKMLSPAKIQSLAEKLARPSEGLSARQLVLRAVWMESDTGPRP